MEGRGFGVPGHNTRPPNSKIRKHENMKMTLSTYDIADALKRDNNANWSYAGAQALAEHLEEYEESTGEELELDIVAIRCDFSEYPSLEDWASEYFSDIAQAADALGLTVDMSGDEFEEDEGDITEATREYIQDRATLIEFDGGIIVSSF
jgi:hypothetical protein